MSLWDALRMNMMISYQELVRTFLSSQKSEQRWELDCTNQAKGKSFQFAVYPSEKAPYGVSRSFYLEAINDDAKQSAEQGLMRYLQINTQAG